jgi:acetate kinase
MTVHALVLNAGSSSLKFCAYQRAAGEEWTLDARGQVEGIGSAPKFAVRDGAGAVVAERALSSAKVRDVRDGLQVLAGWLHDRYRGAPVAGVGHRVVHGGAKYARPCIVTPQVIDDLRTLGPLAPLHQPYNVFAIEAVAERLPNVPQVACFDTGFHHSQPAVTRLVPLPEEFRAAGVQRYGFHGLSYEYVSAALATAAPEIAHRRVIVGHLGSGASLCAMKDGKSVDCTMGFTALDGLCMGTRPGALDPGVVLHLFQAFGMSPAEVEKLLYRQSGLLALSESSNDMRNLLGNPDPRARMAIDYFVYQAAKQIGALAAVLGGLDALVFTAGIGEHSAEIRRRICEGAAWLGIDLDATANLRHATRITTKSSPISSWVIPTNEELMIARHTGDLLGLRRPVAAAVAQGSTL